MPKRPTIDADELGRGLTLRHNTWFARLNIPKDVRPIFGDREIFITSTKERDIHKAHAVGAPMLNEWRRRIAEARASMSDPAQAEIQKLAEAYRQAKGDQTTENSVLYSVVSFIFERFGGLSPDQRRAALTAAHGDVATAMAVLPSPAIGHAALAHVTGTALTPFLAHFTEWQNATHLTGRSKKQAIKEIEEFAASHPGLTLEMLTGGMVQKWLKSLRQIARPETIRHKLNSVRSYWIWMQGRQLVSESVAPFTGRKILDSRTVAEITATLRQRWTPAEVVTLWTAAAPDRDVFALSKIAAFTGARREEICGLKVCHIKVEFGIRHFDITDAKTQAGVRLVPIHSAIADLIDSLITNANKDGYLIHDGELDADGCRGNAVGQRFSDLKTKLGYDGRKVFHSFRKTVAFELAKAKVEGGVIEDICGWESTTMRKHYAGVADLATKRDAIELLAYPS